MKTESGTAESTDSLCAHTLSARSGSQEPPESSQDSPTLRVPQNPAPAQTLPGVASFFQSDHSPFVQLRFTPAT